MKIYISIIFTVLLIILLTNQPVSSSRSIETMAKPNWNITSKNSFNKGCWSQKGKCFGRCRITGKRCVKLINYDEEVCGCNFCVFNKTLNKCIGQCSNIVTDRCVSKVANPTQDSDCGCASCRAFKIKDEEEPDVEIPVCDKSTCFSGNNCKPYQVRSNLKQQSQLECMCLNQ